MRSGAKAALGRRPVLSVFVVAVVVVGVAVSISIVGSRSATEADPIISDFALDAERVGEIIADARSAAPRDQSSALADGVVSEREYLDAADATLRCLERALDDDAAASTLGVTFSVSVPPTFTEDRFLVNYSYRLGYPEGATESEVGSLDDQAGFEAEGACQSKHLDATQTVYQARLLADSAWTTDVAERFASCLDQHPAVSSLELPVQRPRDNLLRIMSQFADDETVVDLVSTCAAAFPGIIDLTTSEQPTNSRG